MSREMANGERKAQLLRLARSRGPITAPEVASLCGVSPQYARRTLKQLSDRGRLDRDDGAVHPGSGRSANRYSISARGEEYLSWYEDRNGELPGLP